MDLLTFEETREKVDTVIKLCQETLELGYVLQNIIIPEFRNYYTPNIPSDPNNEDDLDVYIKNRIFQIEIDDDAFPMGGYKVTSHIQNPDGLQYVETISLREFMYVFCNPEGFEVLTKIGLMINNENWDNIRKELHPKSDYSMTDFDDDIPF